MLSHCPPIEGRGPIFSSNLASKLIAPDVGILEMREGWTSVIDIAEHVVQEDGVGM